MKIFKTLMLTLLITAALGISAYAAPAKTETTVYLNGIEFNGRYSYVSDVWYPVFENSGVIYIPLYEYPCTVLGIENPQIDENIIRIEKKENVFTAPIRLIDLSHSVSSLGNGNYGINNFYRYKPYLDHIRETDDIANANLPQQNIIYLAGNEIDNSMEEYPFLSCYNKLYMPLTWENCVDRMGWSYLYDNDENTLIIGCDSQFGRLHPMSKITFEYINGNISARIKYGCDKPDGPTKFYLYPLHRSKGRPDCLYISVNGSEYTEIDYIFTDGNDTKEFWEIGNGGMDPNFEYNNGILSVNAKVNDTEAEYERINIEVETGKILSVEEYKPPVNMMFCVTDAFPYMSLFDEYTVPEERFWRSQNYPFLIETKRDASKSVFVTLDGKKIQTYRYSFDTELYIKCEDLIYYGYDMEWSEETRTTVFTKNENKPWVDYEDQPNDEQRSYTIIYPTDWKIVIDGREIERGYNIGGYTIIPLYELYGLFEIRAQ